MKPLLFALAATFASGLAAADPGMDLAQKKNCLACHALDKKLVGPAYKDIAAKYGKDKDAAAKLAEKIVKGSTGTWGPVPMPPNQVTPEEASQLAKWVLTVK